MDKKSGKKKDWVQYYWNGVPIQESTGTSILGEAKIFLNSKEGDVAKGIPISPKMERLKFSEMADDVINNYCVSTARQKFCVVQVPAICIAIYNLWVKTYY